MQTVKRGYFYRKWSALNQWMGRQLLTIILSIVLLFSAVIVLWPLVFVLVPVGKIGVIYRPLAGGVDFNMILREGAHLTLPWNKVYQYDAQIQLKELKLELLTSDLLKTNVTVTFQYEVNTNTLPLLHKYIGTDYLEKVIVPQVTKVTREKVAKLNAKMAYTGDIALVANDIAITADSLLIQQISPPGLSDVRLIRVSAVQLISVTYPPVVQSAIENKIIDAENAEAYKYKVQAARQEAERKVIEATGIRDFQNIVNNGLTENYLRYRGIEATEVLAKSTNAKTLIFGSGPSGLPLILGNAVDTPAPKETVVNKDVTEPTSGAKSAPNTASEGQKETSASTPTTSPTPDKKQ